MSESNFERDDIQEPAEMNEINESVNEEYREDTQDFQGFDEEAGQEPDFQADSDGEPADGEPAEGEEAPAGGESVSATAVYVRKAKQMLQDYQEGQKQKTRVANEVKQCEKSVAANEKSVADSIASATKKRREEIAASYDKELAGIQDSIDAVKVERQKAKANAIAQRIQRETAPISQSNQELEEQIEMKYRENKVPFLARSQAISGLFIRKSLKDWIFTLVFAAVMLFLIPLFIILGMAAHPVGLAFVMFVYMLVIFGLYLYLLNHCFIKYSGINDEVDELRRQIRANDKTKQSISSRIKKDENEEGYHLEEYDNEIARLQGQMEETINQRQAALDQFESEMRSQIAADVTAEKQEETAAVEKRLEDARKAQVTLDNELAAMEAVIREEYEPIFGKDLLHKNKLDSLAQFCEDHPDLTTEEAVAQFRNTR